MLVALHIELQRAETRLVHNIMHPMNDGLGGDVIFAPDSSRHRPALTIGGHGVNLIAARALDWCDVKPEQVAGLTCTFNVDYIKLASSSVLLGFGRAYKVRGIGGREHMRHPSDCRLGKSPRISL